MESKEIKKKQWKEYFEKLGENYSNTNEEMREYIDNINIKKH